MSKRTRRYFSVERFPYDFPTDWSVFLILAHVDGAGIADGASEGRAPRPPPRSGDASVVWAAGVGEWNEVAAGRGVYVKPSGKRDQIGLARCAHRSRGCTRPNATQSTSRNTITNGTIPRKASSFELSRRTGASLVSVSRSFWHDVHARARAARGEIGSGEINRETPIRPVIASHTSLRRPASLHTCRKHLP